MQAVHRAFQPRDSLAFPTPGGGYFRKLDTERCEDMFLSLQTGSAMAIPRRWIRAGLFYKAKLNGYEAPSGSSSAPRTEAPSNHFDPGAVNALDDKIEQLQRRLHAIGVEPIRFTREVLREDPWTCRRNPPLGRDHSQTP